jgi:hypothetical protein
MPTRYLKPGIRDSERIDRLQPLAEVLFYRLLVTVDDFGRTDARPAMVKAACFPVRDSVDAATCGRLLVELADCGLIDLYTVDGKPCLQMRKWDNTPRAKESKFPGPDDTRAQMHASACKPRAPAGTPRADLPVTETETGTETENRKPEPETATEVATGPKTPPPRRAKPEGQQTATAELWDAYAGAYIQRYGVQPVRNATVNGQLAAIVARLGRDEAPPVARFYLQHKGAFYVRTSHAVGLFLKDCEALRTQWATGQAVTNTQAQQTDKTQTNADAFAPLLARARAAKHPEDIPHDA